jgi:hypothetical protein
MERFYKVIRLGIFFLLIYFFMTADWIYTYLETMMDSNTATMWGNFYVAFIFLGIIVSLSFLAWEKKQ